MEIRSAQYDDRESVAQVITEAFADDGQVAELWSDVVVRDLDRASLVGVDGGVVVGHVGVSHGWLDARRSLVDVLVLSPLSVIPARQGEGIGTTLVAAAMAAARSVDAPALFLEGSPHYYGRRGFERASCKGFEAPSRRTPEPAFQVALLPAHEEWMTGRLIYRDVWWEHDCAGLRDPELSEVQRVPEAPG